LKNQETKENHDVWYFSILLIIAVVIIGVISSLDSYNLYTDIRAETDNYDRLIEGEKSYKATIGKIYELSKFSFINVLFY